MAAQIAKPNSLISTILPQSASDRRWAYVALALLGTLVLYASAKVSVPFYPVPMTLQTMAIVVIAAAYGWRLGLATIVLYLVEGALGLPVFSGTPEKGIGLVYMMGTTGGYLLGFIIQTLIVGWFAERGGDRRPVALFLVMIVSDAVVIGLGYLWLSHLIGTDKAVTFGVMPFLLGDAVKIAIGALVVWAGNSWLRRV